MTWPALFGVFILCHLFGDFLLQTDWQASNKQAGLRERGEHLRALSSHAFLYTLAFLPALIWIGIESGVLVAIAVAAGIGIPHAIVDDGTLVSAWVRRVKHVHGAPSTVVRLGVDQSSHVLALALVAYLVTG
jgi:hypothetical protein